MKLFTELRYAKTPGAVPRRRYNLDADTLEDVE